MLASEVSFKPPSLDMYHPVVSCSDGLDLSQSSLIQGVVGKTAASVGSPYQAVPSNLKEHWRVLEENKDKPFSKWDLKVLVAWLEAGLGELV